MNWTEIIIFGIIVILSVWISYYYQMKRRDKYREDQIKRDDKYREDQIKNQDIDREENNKVTTFDNKVTTLDNKVTTLDNKVTTLDNKVTTLDNKVSDQAKDISDLKKDVSDLKKDISNVSTNFRVLVSYLKGRFGQKLSDGPLSDTRAGGIATTGLGTAKAASPLVLTSNSLESAHRMGAEEIAKKYQHHIIVPDDANKLVIQQECFDFVFSGRFLTLVSQKDKDIIQNEIDESRKKREETLLIFGILFRDIILKSRGLPVPVSSEETESPS